MNRSEAFRLLRKVMNEGHSGRITQSTLDYWRSEPTDDKVVIVLCLDSTNSPKAVSACKLKPKTKSDTQLLYRTVNTITVTHPDYRGLGWGTKALARKIELLTAGNVHYKTTVAEDNLSSQRIIQKVGLRLLKATEATRNDGSNFIRNTYVTHAFLLENGNEVDSADAEDLQEREGNNAQNSGIEWLEPAGVSDDWNIVD